MPPPRANGDLNSHSDLLTFDVVRNVSCGTDNLHANFGVSTTIRCRVTDKHASDWRHDLDLITLTFEVNTHVKVTAHGDAGHHAPSLCQVWSSSISRSEDMAHFPSQH